MGIYRNIFLSALIAAATVAGGCGESSSSNEKKEIRNYTYKIINKLPHNPKSFTQGLVYEDGLMYEGTGLNGQSEIFSYQPGNVDRINEYSLENRYFGEGITIFGNKIIQLTWKSRKGFVYDKYSFELIDEFEYDYEGWGITHDGYRLIISDGTNKLHFLDPETYRETGHVIVTNGKRNISMLNELEYIDGLIYANIWRSSKIAMIDPETGNVKSWLNLRNILDYRTLTSRVDVLNGIAYNSESGRLYVTGKLWPYIFEIELSESK